jgi:hypothetical protein
MPGYLDQYGAGEEQRNRTVLRSIIAVVLIVVSTALGWYLLKNHHQEGVVKTFVEDVRKGDYEAAYRDWGCTTEKPCAGYSLDKFKRDWGPGNSAPDPAVLGLSDAESCNKGVLLTLDVNRTRQEKLWVNKDEDLISFAPYPICPFKNPFSIMMHRTIGRLRKPLLK